MHDAAQRLSAMLQQELTNYKTEDYLATDFQRHLSVANKDSDDDASLSSASNNHSLALSSRSSLINEVWREKICEWSYQVVDHFDYSRELVSVSINYLDRFLSTRRVNKKSFQLAAMTCLFLAIKLYERRRLSMASLIELSSGHFTVLQMEIMEKAILRALNWKVHPPTAYCFAQHIICLLRCKDIDPHTGHDVLEVARFLTELSVIDYFFVFHRPSVIGVAALVNALDIVTSATEISNTLCEMLKETFGIDVSSDEIMECRMRIHLLYIKGGYSHFVSSAVVEPARDEVISPVCVSQVCQHTTPAYGKCP